MAFTLVVKSAHGLLLCKVTFGSLKRKRERERRFIVVKHRWGEEEEDANGALRVIGPFD